MVKYTLLLLPLIASIAACSEITELIKEGSRLIYTIGISAHSNQALNESSVLPNAAKVYTFNNSSNVFKEAVFYANMCKTSNCRANLDKWDCDNCTSTLPDGVVVRSFQTFPLGVTGEIITSEERSSIYVVVRGASSLRNKLLFFSTVPTKHPMIPGAKVQTGALAALFDVRDLVYQAVYNQLSLYPTYKVRVVGHSFGSSVGSLLTVDLFQRLPILWKKDVSGYLFGKPRVGDRNYAKYVADEKINIRRYVERDDDIVHHPDLKDGYMHEGVEYWLESKNPYKLVVCLGHTETRNCSSSLNITGVESHLNYFGVEQGCESDIFNLI